MIHGKEVKKNEGLDEEVKAYFTPKSGGLYAITVKGRKVLVHEKRALYKRRKKNTGVVSVAL